MVQERDSMKKSLKIIIISLIVLIIGLFLIKNINNWNYFKSFFSKDVTVTTSGTFLKYEKIDELFTEFTVVDVPVIALPYFFSPPKGYEELFDFLSSFDSSNPKHMKILDEISSNEITKQMWMAYSYELKYIHEYQKDKLNRKKALPLMFTKLSKLFPDISPHYFCFKKYEVSFGYKNTNMLIEKYKEQVCSGDIDSLPIPTILATKAIGKTIMGTSAQAIPDYEKETCEGWDKKGDYIFTDYDNGYQIKVDRKSQYLILQKLKDDGLLNMIFERSKKKLAIFIGVFCYD